MKTFNISIISALLIFILNCQTITDPDVKEEIKRVSISSSEVFEYKTGISGDEELATITQQAEHYKTSKMVRDSTTDWEAVYKYKPENGFKGTDDVELKLGTGSDGASEHTNIKLIKIEISID